jgi:hypothetical protein
MAIQKASVSIASLDEWLEHAGPKGWEKHWKYGRSAELGSAPA